MTVIALMKSAKLVISMKKNSKELIVSYQGTRSGLGLGGGASVWQWLAICLGCFIVSLHQSLCD